jgi:hypothetical protein
MTSTLSRTTSVTGARRARWFICGPTPLRKPKTLSQGCHLMTLHVRWLHMEMRCEEKAVSISHIGQDEGTTIVMERPN